MKQTKQRKAVWLDPEAAVAFEAITESQVVQYLLMEKTPKS